MTQEKQIIAISKYNRVAPKKIEKYLRLIKGKTYIEALKLLLFLSFKQKPISIVLKLLYCGAANAYHNSSIEKENLIIKEAFVTRGNILKRIQPRARGKSYKIEKIISHVTIKLKQK